MSNELPVFKEYVDAMAAGLKEKDLLYFDEGSDIGLRKYVCVGDGFHGIFPELGLRGLPDAKYFEDGHRERYGSLTHIIHDGQWVQLSDKDLGEYKPAVNLFNALKTLTSEFKCPDGCRHSLVYDVDSDSLILGLWVDGDCRNFYITQDELRDINKLTTDIRKMLAEEIA